MNIKVYTCLSHCPFMTYIKPRCKHEQEQFICSAIEIDKGNYTCGKKIPKSTYDKLLNKQDFPSWCPLTKGPIILTKVKR
jgi:hypothetical protein